MARGDPIFARLDVSLMHDHRIRKLTAAQKWVYIAYYLSAVELRSELLPESFDHQTITDRAGTDHRTSLNALGKCIQVGLLEIGPEGRVRVIGARKNNPKLQGWNDEESSPYGACKRPYERREEERREEPLTPKGAYSADFELFWTAYPKKIGKGAAFKTWSRIKARPPVQELIEAVTQQIGWDQWKTDHGKYIPNPATWLNQSRWLDERPCSTPNNKPTWEEC